MTCVLNLSHFSPDSLPANRISGRIFNAFCVNYVGVEGNRVRNQVSIHTYIGVSGELLAQENPSDSPTFTERSDPDGSHSEDE